MPKKMQAAATLDSEDLKYATYRAANAFVIKRKSDGKVLALPWTPETNELWRTIRIVKHDFIGGVLAKHATGTKWRSPRSLGLKRSDDREALYA